MSRFIYSRKNWVKIYWTSDLDSMMNGQPEDRQWTPTLEDGLSSTTFKDMISTKSILFLFDFLRFSLIFLSLESL